MKCRRLMDHGATPVARRRRQILSMPARKGAQAALHALNALPLLIFSLLPMAA